MARRFDGSTDALSITSSLPSFTTTIMGWFKVSVDGNQFHNFMAFGDSSGGLYVQLCADFTGANTNLFIWDGTNSVTGSNISVGAWNHLCLVVRSPTGAGASGPTSDDMLGYLNGVLDITNPDASDGVSAEKLWIGNDNDAEFLNGCAAAIKIWSGAELTAEEIVNEMRQYLPQRTANLYGFWPLLNDQTDYGGAGRAWTVGGTLATEDGPPIPWSNDRRRRVHIAAAGGGGGAVPMFRRRKNQVLRRM